MGKNLDIIMLFDFYRGLLTDKQAEVVDLYYNEDLSLAEISEHLSVTRQGVRDNIKRAEACLVDAENKLGMVERYNKRRKVLSEAEKLADDILQDTPHGDLYNRVALLKKLICGIEE